MFLRKDVKYRNLDSVVLRKFFTKSSGNCFCNSWILLGDGIIWMFNNRLRVSLDFETYYGKLVIARQVSLLQYW